MEKNKNIIYRVRVMYYEEFCGCHGDTVVFEKHYTSKAAAKKKIKELKKQLQSGTFKITKDYTFKGKYRDDFVGLRRHFDRTNDIHEMVLFSQSPYQDVECLHMLPEPEEIMVEDLKIEEDDVNDDDDYDGTPISMSERILTFAKPKCEEKVIADAFGLEPACQEEGFSLYENNDMSLCFNREDIDIILNNKNDAVLKDKILDYFDEETWKKK